MTTKLKFEHDMEKLPQGLHGQTCVLEAIRTVRLEDMPEWFIKYDTKIRGKDEYYKFPNKGLYILLYFNMVLTGVPFTTLRTFSSPKFNKHKALLHQMHEIEILDAPKPVQIKLVENAPLISAVEAPR